MYPLPWNVPFPLLDGSGLHLPPGATNYRAPASVDNDQDNLTQEFRLQSSDPNARLVWTTGLFFSSDRQSYLEQIHDPYLNELTEAVLGIPYQQTFCYVNAAGTCVGVPYDSRFPNDSYFLQTFSKDQQYALFGEGTFAFTDQLKATLGMRYSQTEFSFNTLTGGPQLFLPPQTGTGDKKENSFTPKASIEYQYDPHDLYYFTYAKGFRSGRRQQSRALCGLRHRLRNFGIPRRPSTFNSDTVDSFEIGAKNNFDNRVKIASSIYYIRWNNIQQVGGAAHLSDLLHHEPGPGGRQGRGHPGRHRASPTNSPPSCPRATPTPAIPGLPIVAHGDHAYRRQRRCHRRPERPARAAGHRLARSRIQIHAFARTRVFVRVDDEYEAGPSGLGASQDPTTLQYDSANYTLSSTNFASARAGMKLRRLADRGILRQSRRLPHHHQLRMVDRFPGSRHQPPAARFHLPSAYLRADVPLPQQIARMCGATICAAPRATGARF